MSEFADIKMPRKNKDGEYNMCKAVEELKAAKRSGLSESDFMKYIEK